MSEEPVRLVRPNSLRKRVWVATRFVRVLLRLAAASRLFVRVKVTGRENVPKHGGALLAFNHLSYADPLILLGVLARNVAFLAGEFLFKNRSVRRFLLWAGNIPVFRGTNAALDAVVLGCEVLEGEGLLAMAPEGKIPTQDSERLVALGGMAIQAFRTGKPVIPVGIRGTDELWPFRKRPRLGPRRKVEVHIGQPIHPPYTSADASLEDRRLFTDTVMAAIAVLSRQALPPKSALS